MSIKFSMLSVREKDQGMKLWGLDWRIILKVASEKNFFWLEHVDSRKASDYKCIVF